MAEKQEMKLSGVPLKKATKLPKDESLKAKATKSVVDDDDDDDENEILSEVEPKGKSKNTMLFIVLGVASVVIIAFLFLVLGGAKGKDAPSQAQPEPVQQEQQQQQVQTQSVEQPQQPEQQVSPNINVGTQDFTGNTNMTTSSVLTDPDSYIEDLYGLTTRVDYTVNSITNIADFVSYEKHRGTWGGGLELYWLDATYKNKHYVVQVPFKYYKELDDVGIVPVRMEVLTINGTGGDEKLTVISYMCLDEEVLKDILKGQSKAK